LRIEFPSKPVGETINLGVDFISRLASGETINTGSCAATLYSGTDPNPSGILSSLATVSGTSVIQQITGGVRGNIYELAYTAVTSLGQTLLITGYFAIVPDLP
jgi:hypothetical protein